METEKKIPVYQSKKTINALEIDKVVLDKETASKEGRQTDGSALLKPKDETFKDIKVNDVFLRKNNVSDGGYLIFGENGKYFMSKEEFESNFEENIEDEAPDSLEGGSSEE